MYQRFTLFSLTLILSLCLSETATGQWREFWGDAVVTSSSDPGVPAGTPYPGCRGRDYYGSAAWKGDRINIPGLDSYISDPVTRDPWVDVQGLPAPPGNFIQVQVTTSNGAFILRIELTPPGGGAAAEDPLPDGEARDWSSLRSTLFGHD